MLSYSYYSTAFFNFKAKDGFFTKNSVYARTKNRAQHFSMHPAEITVSFDRIQIDLDVREFFPEVYSARFVMTRCFSSFHVSCMS